MKKRVGVIFSVVGAIVLAMLAYHLISPKVSLANHSALTYDEFIVELPGSRVSMGPVSPGSEQLIYFSPREQGGTLRYSLHGNGEVLVSGAMPYSADGQLFRKINALIHEDGTVSVTQ